MASTNLVGRVAIVTGAGSGIGQASAVALATAGASVVCTDIDAEAAERTAEQAGGDSYAVWLDVTDRPAVHRVTTSARDRYGRLDIFANVAGGVTARGPVTSLSEQDFDGGLALNLKGMLFGCQAAAGVMQRGGSIINVGSGTVDAGVADLAAYSIPKAGVLQLTRSLARELGPAGIRVNTVSPGYILTGMTDVHFRDSTGTMDEAERERVIDSQVVQIPLGRPGRASEVATVVVFLAGDDASYITGQSIRVNGGSVMPL